jgi:hypothetical protein
MPSVCVTLTTNPSASTQEMVVVPLGSVPARASEARSPARMRAAQASA